MIYQGKKYDMYIMANKRGRVSVNSFWTVEGSNQKIAWVTLIPKGIIVYVCFIERERYNTTTYCCKRGLSSNNL